MKRQASTKPVLQREVFNIQNRKYLGSKANLLPQILKNMIETVGRIDSFTDIFAGTGVVTAGINRFFPKAQLTVNDHLYSNYVVYQTYFGCKKNEIDTEKIYSYIDICNKKKGYYGYATHNFGGTYLSIENAKKIDEIRDYIDQLFISKKITFKEKCFILTALLYALDKVANTCGQYDSFLKHMGSKSMDGGVHKVDSNVYKELSLQIPNLTQARADNMILCMDANILVEHVKCQVMYVDPPYSCRQYIDNYHLLENIAKWEKPEVYGKTKKFKRDEFKSLYCQKKYVAMVFDSLIKRINAEHVFISYNSEGLMTYDQVKLILKKYGRLAITEIPYNIFGNGAGQSRKRPVTEYLFHLKP